jgi:hypothetical protein
MMTRQSASRKRFPLLEGLSAPSRKRRCGFTRFRETLDAADKQILDDAMADPAWSTHGLSQALRERGAGVTYQTVYRHRTQACACHRKEDDDARQPATG